MLLKLLLAGKKHLPEEGLFFLAGSAVGEGGFPDQERKIPEILTFSARKSSVSDIPGFPDGDGDHSLAF
jgi:hypothetical protein